jgi:hypothetical protein
VIRIPAITAVFYAPGNSFRQAQAIVRLPDQQQPGIRGDLPTIKIYCQLTLPKE